MQASPVSLGVRIALLAAAVAAAPAAAAPRRPYGGTCAVSVLERPLHLAPRELATAADVTISGLLYEPLYGIDARGALTPVLARGAPELRGGALWVPLRAGVVFHDGTPLTPARVRDHFVGLADDVTASAFVVWPVKGALERSGGDASARVRIVADERDNAVSFELVEPYLEFARILASPRAAVTGAAVSEGLPPGTGPFAVSSAPARSEKVTVTPFLPHRDGRPFLDVVTLDSRGPRSGASALRRDSAAIVFGPLTGRGSRREAHVAWDGSVLPLEQVILALGDRSPALATPRSRAAIDAALDRKTLAVRFLGSGAEPASTLLPVSSSSGRGPAGLASERPISARLLVSSDDRALRRVADRVQLDLLRAGITVIIDPTPAATLEARQRDRDYDLLLATALPDGRAPLSALDGLHALLSLAAAFGVRAPIAPAELAAILRSSEEARRASLVALERSLRLERGLIPIAARAPELRVAPELAGWALSPLGRVELDWAYVTPEAE